MSKTLDVVTAGIIAGIVAYATAILGIGGTVIGSVLGAILVSSNVTYIQRTVGKN